MALERLGAQHNAVVDKYVDPIISYVMSVRDYVVRPSAAAAITITLPHVSLAKGRTYTILARAATRANTITITDAGDSEYWVDTVLRGTGEMVSFYSDGLVWVNVSGGSLGSTITTILSPAVKTLAATQVELVPAPGTGRVIEFLSATLKLFYAGTNVFTEAADNLVVVYTDAAGVVVSDVIETTGFIDQAAHMITRGVPINDAIVTYAASQNQALVLDNNNAEIAGNAGDDNILYVYTLYRIITLI